MTTTLTSIINSPCPEALRGLAGTFLVPLFRARVPTPPYELAPSFWIVLLRVAHKGLSVLRALLG